MLDFKEWLIREAREKVIVYHGTSDRNLPKIISQGLIPDPKEKVWEVDPDASFTNVSRQAIGGIYVTKNLMTASSSALNSVMNREGGSEAYYSGKESQLIVIIEAQPETIVADEDDISFEAKRMPSPYPNRVGAHTHEYSALQVYEDYLNNNPEFKKWQEEYVKLNLQHFGRNIHPKLKKRLEQVLAEGFISTLKRAVAYLDGYTSKKIPLPNREEAEREYANYLDKLTRLLKNKALQSFLSVGRILTPVRFSGANKIVAIVILKNKPERCLKVVYGKYHNNLLTIILKMLVKSNGVNDF